jgi:hypothetical protein
MFVGKAKRIADRAANLKVLHSGRLWLFFKHKAKLEKLARDQLSSLL